MSALTDERTRLATEIATETGLTVYDHLPERLTLPAVFLAPDDPYVTRGIPGTDDAVPLGKVRVNHEVIAVAGKGTNARTIAKLDDMVWAIVTAMAQELGDVGRPGQITLSIGGVKATYLAVAISLSTLVTLA